MDISYSNFKGIIKQNESGEWFIENIHPYKYKSICSKDIGKAMEYWKQDVMYIVRKEENNNENGY